MSDRPVFRFAPSPNGELHLGHALSALTGFAQARAAGGRFLLRIEDIDTTRSRPAYIDGIFRDLAWLGLDWEQPVLHQSTRFGAYGQAARRLETLGILYPCFATRAEIQAAADPALTDPDGAPLYPGLHKSLSGAERARRKAAGQVFALRLDMDRALSVCAEKNGGAPLSFVEQDEAGNPRAIMAQPGRWGDAIVIRKDIPASYHLAVVVDDAFQGVTHVSRGRDLFAATDIQRLLQCLLDLPVPRYSHHRLIHDQSGRKLSKSEGDQSLRALRDAGHTAAEIRSLVGLR